MSHPPAPPAAHPWWLVSRRVLSRATANFGEDRCTLMAASISYFALLSLFPLALLAVSIFGIVLRDADVQARVLDAIVDALPVEETSIADSLRAVAGGGPTLTIVSLGGAIWTAGALSRAIRSSINVAFDVRRPRPPLRGILVDYSLLPVVGVLFLSSFLVTAAWRVVQAQTDARIELLGGQSSLLWDAGALAIPAALSFLTFLFLYWLLPNLPVRLRDIWPGALVAGLGIELAKHGFALYLANFANYELVYGSLGGVIALLFWVYLNANILLFGAEIAAEVPHVLREEPRHGHTAAAPTDWRASLLSMLRGLVLAPGDQAGPAADTAEHPGEEAGGEAAPASPIAPPRGESGGG